MSFKKPTVNKVVTDIQSLTIYLRSVRKWGKTTLFRDLILEKYGDPEYGLLVGMNAEAGYSILDNLNVTQCETWKDMKELKKWLISEKGKEHNIKMIAFDVVEELLPMAEQEVIRMSNAEGKATTTFNGSFGGYGEPRKKLQKLIKDYFVDLRKAGFGIFCIGHTKIRTIREKGDETEGYNVLTSTLSDDYESLFSDIFDCVLTGTIEKTVNSKKITGEERRLYMRGTGYISAGCRFAPDSVPEFIVYEGNFARKFIDTLEDGLRNSKTKPISKEEFKKEQIKEAKELEERVFVEEEEQEPTLNKAEAVNIIKANISKLNFADVQNVMKKHGFTNFNNPDEIPEEGLLEILKMIK